MKKITSLRRSLAAAGSAGLLLLIGAAGAAASPGDPDPGFAQGGTALLTGQPVGQLSGLARQSGGGVVASGIFNVGAGLDDVVSLTSAGQLNTAFGSGGGLFDLGLGTLGLVQALPDDSLVALGFSENTLAFSRYTAAGQPVAAFGSGGTATLSLPAGAQPFVTGLAPMPDGGFAGAGWYTDPATQNIRSFAVKVDAAGRPAPQFGSGGIVTLAATPHTQALPGLVVQPSGRIVLALDESTPHNGVLIGATDLIALDGSTGAQDPSFGTQDTGGAEAIAAGPNGGIITVNGAPTAGGSGLQVVLFNAAGQPSLAAGGLPMLPVPGIPRGQGLSITSVSYGGGFIVAAAYFVGATDVTPVIGRFDQSGRPDTGFGNCGALEQSDSAMTDQVIAAPDGTILESGTAMSVVGGSPVVGQASFVRRLRGGAGTPQSCPARIAPVGITQLPTPPTIRATAIVKHGVASVGLSCPKALLPCSGQLQLTALVDARGRYVASGARRQTHAVTIGNASYSLPNGQSAILAVKLSAAGRRLLAAARGHRLVVREGLRLDGIVLSGGPDRLTLVAR